MATYDELGQFLRTCSDQEMHDVLYEINELQSTIARLQYDIRLQQEKNQVLDRNIARCIRENTALRREIAGIQTENKLLQDETAFYKRQMEAMRRKYTQ